jgi:hypothetical protein
MADEGTSSAAPPNGAAPPPGGSPPSGGEWTSSLPAEVRGHASLSDVKDVGDLATRYVKLNRPFAEQLPEKIRSEAAFKDIRNLEGLADSYYNAQKMIGVPKDQLLRIPQSDKPEDWASVYDKLGRPARPADYTLKVPEGFPPAEKEYAESVMATAHGAGLTQKQFETMTGWLYERAGTQIAARKANEEARVEAWICGLKTEYGQAFGPTVERANAAVGHYDDAAGLKGELRKALDETGLGNHPAFVKLFHHLSRNLHEDGKLTGKAFGADAMKSPVEYQQQINALRQDTGFMKQYLNPNKRDPAHIEAVGKMEALYKLAHPDPGQGA